MNHFRGMLIVIGVLLYWALVYYPFHYTIFTAISMITGVIVLSIIGGYYLLIREVELKDVEPIVFLCFVGHALSIVFITYFSLNYGMSSRVDITFSFLYHTLGLLPAVILGLMFFPAIIFLVIGTRKIFGEEYLYFWTMVLLAWIASGFKLIHRFSI